MFKSIGDASVSTLGRRSDFHPWRCGADVSPTLFRYEGHKSSAALLAVTCGRLEKQLQHRRGWWIEGAVVERKRYRVGGGRVILSDKSTPLLVR